MHRRPFIKTPLYLASLVLAPSSLLIAPAVFAPGAHAAVLGDNAMPQRDQDLLAAAAAGETWKVRDLLADGARLEVRETGYGFTPLMRAAAAGQVGTVRYLISKGAKVNARSREGVAFQLGQTNSATEAVTGNPNVALQSRPTLLVCQSGGVTPLMLACAGGYNVTARELIGHGADVNARNPDGDTALMYAAFKGYLPTVQTLLAHGADVNAVELRRGQSVLQHAVLGNNLRVVRLLLDRGAKVDVKDRFGATAYSLAWDRDYREMARAIRAAGIKQRAATKTPQGKAPVNAPAPPPQGEPGFIILN